MKVEHITAHESGAWQAYVAGSPGATFYHQVRWTEALERAYGIRTWRLAAIDGDRVCGILPLAEIRSFPGKRALISLPFGNYGGVVADGPDEEARLLEEAGRLLARRHGGYMELKHVVRSTQAGLVDKLCYHSLALDLAPGAARLWQEQLNGKVRNQVRKARKMGVTVTAGADLLPLFLSVYRRNLRDLGTPTHSMKWFRTLGKLFGDEMDVVVAMLDGKPVAGGWLFFFKDTAILHAAASLKAFRAHCPNNLVYWHAIERACERGCRTLDLARSRVGQGTYHFKQQWGAVPRQTYYQYMVNAGAAVPDVDPGNARFKTAIRLWQQLPLPVANVLGPLLRRRIST